MIATTLNMFSSFRFTPGKSLFPAWFPVGRGTFPFRRVGAAMSLVGHVRQSAPHTCVVSHSERGRSHTQDDKMTNQEVSHGSEALRVVLRGFVVLPPFV